RSNAFSGISPPPEPQREGTPPAPPHPPGGLRRGPGNSGSPPHPRPSAAGCHPPAPASGHATPTRFACSSLLLLHCQSQDVQNALGLRVPNSTGERRPLDLCSLLLLGVGVAEPVIRGHEGRDRLLSEVPNQTVERLPGNGVGHEDSSLSTTLIADCTALPQGTPLSW